MKAGRASSFLGTGWRRAHGAARLGALVALAVVSLAPPALAASELESRFATAAASLERGDFESAIRELESLADRGHVHPDLSFNRGLAYWSRARSELARPGDLGRAAAGLEEAHLLRPTDGQARELAEFVRAEVRSRRHRVDKDDPIVRPTLGRVVLSLASPLGFGALAFVSSLLAATGLLLRRSSGLRLRVTGSLSLALGAIGLAGFAPLAVASTWHDEHQRPAVVVVPEIALRGADGNPVEAPVLPEGSLVDVGKRHGDLVELRWGAYEGRVPWSAVRLLARPGVAESAAQF